MTELQSILLQILKVFDRICREENISYFAVDGTLLGAVRHQGFIPWDDDIDIGMLRPDYERFLDVSKDYLPEYYFLQTYITDPEYPKGFAKIRDSRTTFIESELKNRKMNHGIYIDLFPFDYYPDNTIQQIIIKAQKALISTRIRSTAIIKKEDRYPVLVESAVKVLGKQISLKYRSISDAVEARNRLYYSIPYSPLVTNYESIYKDKGVIPIEWVKECTDFSFEGLKIKGPIKYDDYLRHIYGNYMDLPPKDKRKSHHNVEILDLNKPYTYYLKYNFQNGEKGTNCTVY